LKGKEVKNEGDQNWDKDVPPTPLFFKGSNGVLLSAKFDKQTFLTLEIPQGEVEKKKRKVSLIKSFHGNKRILLFFLC